MQEHMPKLSENSAFIHKLASLCQIYSTSIGIRDMFAFAGAELTWYQEPGQLPNIGSPKMAQVYGWVYGLQKCAPDKVDKILAGVATQLIERDDVSDEHKGQLKQLAQHPLVYSSGQQFEKIPDAITIPDDVEKLLEYQINGIPRATYPLKNRRAGLPSLNFDNEYDIQDLLHALLRPWIQDIRPEEGTPTHAGTSSRMDFLLPKYGIVCEAKFVRDKKHATKIGDELTLDIAHYQAHPGCKQLWSVVYDPNGFIQNPKGVITDIERRTEKIKVRIFIIGTS